LQTMHFTKGKIAAVALILFLLGSLGGGLFVRLNIDENIEYGGPKTEQDEPGASGFLYERRETLAQRPNGFNRVQINGYIRSFNEERETLLYSFIDDPFERSDKNRNLIPTSHITQQGNIFLSGLGKNNFIILNQFGDNITDQFETLRDHWPLGNFAILQNGLTLFSHNHNGLTLSNGNKSAIIAEFDFNSQNYPYIEGADNAQQAVFISKGGATAAAELYRFDLSSETTTRYKSLKGTRNDQVKVCTQQQRAVFIRHALDPTHGEYGEPTAPSSIMILDLQTDTVSEVITSSKLFNSLIVSCEGERITVKEGDKWQSLTFKGTELRNKLKALNDVLALSSDGKEIVIQTVLRQDLGQSEFLMMNLKSGDVLWTRTDGDDHPDDAEQIRYHVLGFVSLTR
jgi:hypothetical protein